MSDAAKTLGISQSAVSQQIARFEDELGVALVERHGRSISATEAGLRILAAIDFLHNLDGFVAGTLADLRDDGDECLEMFCFRSASLAVLPKALRLFAEILPNARLAVREVGSYPDLQRTWESGSCQMGLVHEQTFCQRASVIGDAHRTVLLTEPMSILMHRNNPLSRRQSLTLSELVSEYWVVDSNVSIGFVSLSKATALAGFSPLIRCQTSAVEITASLVAAGGGIALVPSLSGPPRVPGTVLVPLAYPEITRTLVSVRPKGVGTNSRAVRVMEEALLTTTSGSARA
jgi:DNA-binding transcriptional LysR family regulator